MEKIYLFERIEESLRQRYAPTSKLGLDNDLITNIFTLNNESDIAKLIVEKGAIFNPNLLLKANIFANYEPFYADKKRYYLSAGFKKFIDKVLGKNNYTSNKIPFISKNVKNKLKKLKNLDIVFIGFGGAISNIFYNLWILQKTSQLSQVFNKITIFEPENWEFTNIMRVGLPLIHYCVPGFKQIDLELNPYPVIKKLDVIKDNLLDLADELLLIYEYLDEEKIDEILKENPDTIFIGAPDLKTRALLNSKNANFIMVGHSDMKIRITKNPNVNLGLVEETYGTIDVPVLLLNLWLATYKLIDILNEDINSISNNQELFEFDFNSLDNDFIQELKEDFKKNFIENLGVDINIFIE